MYQTEALRDDLGLCGPAGAWGSQKDNSGWSPRSIVLVPDSKHTCKVICDLILVLVVGLILINKSIECTAHTSNMELIFLMGLFGDLVKLRAVEGRVGGHKVVLYASLDLLLGHTHQDHFVWNDTQGLEGEGLDLGAGETF